MKFIADDGKFEVNFLGEETKTFDANKKIARQGGTIAGNTRREIEEKTRKKVVTGQNTKQLVRNMVRIEKIIDMI